MVSKGWGGGGGGLLGGIYRPKKLRVLPTLLKSNECLVLSRRISSTVYSLVQRVLRMYSY
jgi:hypothetical protein